MRGTRADSAEFHQRVSSWPTEPPSPIHRDALRIGVGWTHRRTQLLFAFVVLALTAACGEDDSDVSTVAFVTVEQGSNLGGFPACCEGVSLQAPAMFRFDDAESLSDFWSPYRTNPIDSREIDFDSQTILAVVDVVKGWLGDSVRVSGVNRVGHRLVIDVVLRHLDEQCLRPALISQPFHVISVPKTRLGATLVLTTEHIDCSPP